MPNTPASVVADYLGVADSEGCGDIHTAVKVIGRYEVGDERRDPELVAEAVTNILEWAGDYGVLIDTFIIVKNNEPHATA